MQFLVIVHGELVDLDAPPVLIDRLQRLATERGMSTAQLARQILERVNPQESSDEA